MAKDTFDRAPALKEAIAAVFALRCLRRVAVFGRHVVAVDPFDRIGVLSRTDQPLDAVAEIALEALKRPSAVDFFTDSQYVRGGITGWIAGWKKNGWKTADKKPVKNVDLWKRLDEALGHHKVHWHWVKGHAGHAMNERADELAREAIVAARAGAIGAMKTK